MVRKLGEVSSPCFVTIFMVMVLEQLHGEPFIRSLPIDIILIDFLDKAVNLNCAVFCTESLDRALEVCYYL